jgi:serine protease Do
LSVSDLPAERLKELGLQGGVLVDAVDGLAATAGLRQGDIITQLNSVEVTSAKQFNEAVAKLEPKRDVAVLVRRGEASRFIIIRR